MKVEMVFPINVENVSQTISHLIYRVWGLTGENGHLLYIKYHDQGEINHTHFLSSFFKFKIAAIDWYLAVCDEYLISFFEY